MRHLYSTRAEALRMSGTLVDGSPVLTWTKVDTIVDPSLDVPGELMCRLDMAFVRPGKDQPMPVVAGRAPDRIGLMFFDVGVDVRAGDRIHALSGPVVGTFEVRVVPDPAVDLASAHHMEVQVVEVAQALTGVFPGAAVET
jgi:hypothetical protein